MSYKIANNINNIAQKESIIRLILDESTAVQISDKPVFGMPVTINERLPSLVNKILLPGMVLGWVNYLDVSKFACLTSNNHYVEAANFIHLQQNQIILSKPITLHTIANNMPQSKQILTFSLINI